MAPNESLIRTVLIVIGAIPLLPFLLMAVVMSMMGPWGWGHMWVGRMWNGTEAAQLWLLLGLVPLMVFLGLGYLLYRAVRQPSALGGDTALEELRVAYARGEFSDEEFEERRKRLQERW